MKSEGEKYVLLPNPSPEKAQKTERKIPPAEPQFGGHALTSRCVPLCRCASYTRVLLPGPLWILMPGAFSKALCGVPPRRVQLLGSFPESKHCCIHASPAFHELIEGYPETREQQNPFQ